MTEHPIEVGVGDVQAGMCRRHLSTGVAPWSTRDHGQQVDLMSTQLRLVYPDEEPGQDGIGGNPVVEPVNRTPNPGVTIQSLVRAQWFRHHVPQNS